MDDRKLRFQCLHVAGGNTKLAQEAYDWIVGEPREPAGGGRVKPERVRVEPVAGGYMVLVDYEDYEWSAACSARGDVVFCREGAEVPKGCSLPSWAEVEQAMKVASQQAGWR